MTMKLLHRIGKEIAKVNKRLLENDLFKNESTAFILFQNLNTKRSTQKYIIYYWFGNNVSLNLRIKTVNLVTNLHFLVYSLRQSKIIYLTRCVSGIEPKNFQNFTGRQYVPETKLYKIKGYTVAYIVPVEAHHTSLTSDDSFVLSYNKFVYIFITKYSNDVEKLKALKFGNYINNVEHNNQNHLIYIDCTPKSSYINIEGVYTFLRILSNDLKEKMSTICFSKLDENFQIRISELDENFQEERQNAPARVYVTNIQNNNEFVLKKNYEFKWFELRSHLFNHAAIIMDPVYKNYVFVYIGVKAKVYEIEYILKELEQLNVEHPNTYDWRKRQIIPIIDDPPADFIILFLDVQEYYLQ